jgi:uncharacterized membrane protein
MENTMSSDSKPLKTAVFEDGTIAVVRTDPSQPRLLEVLAIFYEASRARDYIDLENKRSSEQPEVAQPEVAQPENAQPENAQPVIPAKHSAKSRNHAAKPQSDVLGLSERQKAVLEALRTKMDNNKLVAAKAAVLATSANIPLGSLHSVLQSLEKKQLIKTVRAGSARAPAAYQVL